MRSLSPSNLFRLGALCALLAPPFAAGCARERGAAQSAKPGVPAGIETNLRTIGETTQGSYGRLRVGVGSVRKDEYTDESGKKTRGLVAVLFLSRGGAPGGETVVVHQGQRVAGDDPFVVERIEGGYKGVVRLRFEKPPAAQKPPLASAGARTRSRRSP